MNSNQAEDAATVSQLNTTGFTHSSQLPTHIPTAESPAVVFPEGPFAPAIATQEAAGNAANSFADSPLAPATATAEAADATDFADVQLELLVDQAPPMPPLESQADTTIAEPAATSDMAAAPKSIWKMLSLRSAKPARQTSKPTEPLVRDPVAHLAPVSSQASHSSMQSASFVPEAAQADSQRQLGATTADVNADAASSVAEQQDSTEVPSAAASGKRFGFLSSFRRTTAQPVGQLSWQVSKATPEVSVSAQNVLPLQTAPVESQLTSDGTSLVSFLGMYHPLNNCSLLLWVLCMPYNQVVAASSGPTGSGAKFGHCRSRSSSKLVS